ncbi:MAG: hypothetical protein WCK74_10930 [Gemmatimonadaceae bacterium]|jgi:hypothetical protein
MTSFLPRFDTEFFPRLSERGPTFRLMFEFLEMRHQGPYLIVETGTARQPGNWLDGQSTVLFDQFVQLHGGSVYSVDINAEACAAARTITSPQTHVVCNDSVRFLWDFCKGGRPIDLLYLDSYDLNVQDPFPSAFHHVKELTACIASLQRGTLIAIDDNLLQPDGRRVGKGMLVSQFLQEIGASRLMDSHQTLWMLA